MRGGEELDPELLALGCEKYRHVKKQTTATVNYYDITELYVQHHPELDSIIERSIQFSVNQWNFNAQQPVVVYWIYLICN